jgi:hypothetical protein
MAATPGAVKTPTDEDRCYTANHLGHSQDVQLVS